KAIFDRLSAADIAAFEQLMPPVSSVITVWRELTSCGFSVDLVPAFTAVPTSYEAQWDELTAESTATHSLLFKEVEKVLSDDTGHFLLQKRKIAEVMKEARADIADLGK